MEKVKNLFETSQLPGVANLIRSKNIFIKILWIICYIILFAWCGIFLYDTLTSYFEYEVVTNIDIIREEQAQFPTVSFCITPTNFSNEIPKLKNFLFSCEFDSNSCNWTDFETYTNDINEVCYRFNSGKDYYNKSVEIKQTSRSDSSTGLKVFLYLTEFYTEINGYKTPFKTNIFIQNHSTVFRRDHAYIIESGLQIPIGQTFISIERDFVQKLPKPYSGCVKQDTKEYVSNLFQYFIKNSKTYKQKDCFDLCVEEIMSQTCGCNEELGKSSNCFTQENIFECVVIIYLRYRSKELKLPESCLVKCPIECDLVNYKIYQTYAGMFPDQFLANYNFSNEFNKNGVYFSIYYSNLEYTLISQIPKTKTFDLVSNIGGTLGLFVGVSFISFVEIFEIVWEIFFYFFQAQNTKVKNQEN